MKYVYDNSGLTVGVLVTLAREQVNVDVYQICIKGSKPRSLPGARDGLIRLIDLSGKPAKTTSCYQVAGDAYYDSHTIQNEESELVKESQR
jgi:hypothetical protein